METVTVSAIALRSVLNGLNGAPHEIRELQATRGPLVGDDNPINILCAEYNAAVEAHNDNFRPRGRVMAQKCNECGMPVDAVATYHPYAACLMFKACGDSEMVQANLDAVAAHKHQIVGDDGSVVAEDMAQLRQP